MQALKAAALAGFRSGPPGPGGGVAAATGRRRRDNTVTAHSPSRLPVCPHVPQPLPRCGVTEPGPVTVAAPLWWGRRPW